MALRTPQQEFSDATARTSDKLGYPIRFIHGHPKDISQRLQAMTQNPNIAVEKFPLIALLTDYVITHTDILDLISPTILIMKGTKQEYTAEERDQFSFVKLNEIKEEFLSQLMFNTIFTSPTSPYVYNEIWRYYWGKTGLYGNTGNVMNEYIDAIEISNLKLYIKLQSNCGVKTSFNSFNYNHT